MGGETGALEDVVIVTSEAAAPFSLISVGVGKAPGSPEDSVDVVVLVLFLPLWCL